MADRLPNPGRQERADDAEHGSQDETRRVVRSRRQQARDESCDEADDDDPDNAGYHGQSFPLNRMPNALRFGIRVVRTARFRSAAVRPASNGRSPWADIG